MINIRTIKKLTNNDGLTLRKGKPINYKSGYQVATEGIETASPIAAINAVRNYKGDCGIWYSEGIYYVDKCRRVATKRDALKIGKECKQQSVFKWADKSLVWC